MKHILSYPSSVMHAPLFDYATTPI